MWLTLKFEVPGPNIKKVEKLIEALLKWEGKKSPFVILFALQMASVYCSIFLIHRSFILQNSALTIWLFCAFIAVVWFVFNIWVRLWFVEFTAWHQFETVFVMMLFRSVFTFTVVSVIIFLSTTRFTSTLLFKTFVLLSVVTILEKILISRLLKNMKWLIPHFKMDLPPITLEKQKPLITRFWNKAMRKMSAWVDQW